MNEQDKGNDMNPERVLSEHERREFFRIDDMAVIQYQLVSDDEANTTGKKIEQAAFSRLTMMAHFDSMSREINTMAKVIGKSSSNVANCIELLDRKINMIGDFLVASEMSRIDVEPQPINLGAGGACFEVAKKLPEGSMLEVRMILLPEYVGLFSYARVVKCGRVEDAGGGKPGYKAAIEFVDMEDNVRDLITRHVLFREQQQRMRESDTLN